MIRFPRNFSFITVFATALSSARGWRKSTHLVPVLASLVIAAGAVALVSYLLWPTWGTDSSGDPARLPVSVGGTLFNIPIAAIRMKIQRHSGPQERIDLYFAFPSLEPPTAAKHFTADMIEETVPPIDRIFLSITAHHDSLAPDIRVRTIYPRYLGEAAMSLQNGLTMLAFRDGTPYGGEDLFSASAPSLDARCTRDASTSGMCLSERRIDGADLTFRFPRSFLARWRDVANAMDRLTMHLHGAR